jgi:hypothetical protein
MTVKMINGRLLVSSPFCSGKPTDKSFQAHPWLPMDTGLRKFFCPVCKANGAV